MPHEGACVTRGVTDQHPAHRALLHTEVALVDLSFPGVNPFELAVESARAGVGLKAHGRDLHGKRLGQYFIHGLSHSVGLNVHDPADYSQPLEPGMAVTIEPGIYIPEEKIGVRIEDDILITANGAEILTRGLPRDPGQIERLMAGEP